VTTTTTMTTSAINLPRKEKKLFYMYLNMKNKGN